MIELSVGRSVRLAAERDPDRTALILGEESLTHGALNAMGNRIANGLRELGLCKGDRVGVMLANGFEYVAFGYAAAKAGFVMVPLNYRFQGAEIAYQLKDSGAKALIFDGAFREPVERAREELPALLTVVRGDRGAADAASLGEFMTSATPDEPDVQVCERDVFYLGYTSGTTGKPKGALITHRNRSLAYHYWEVEYGIGSLDAALHAGPFHHTAPFGFTLAQLTLGGKVAILKSFDATEALRAISKASVTWSFMVPFMYNAILAVPEETRRSLTFDRLRFFISSASPLPTVTKDGLLKAFPHVGLHEFYGATEAGVITNLRPADQRRKTRCVGRPILDTEIRVLREDGSEADIDEVGELYMRGPTLFDGYFNAPDKNAQAFRQDWCTIGDLGRRDAEGYFYIVDRSKDVIKSGGVNIFPAEIEEALLSHPAVYEATVVGAPSREWGEEVRAVIVLRNGAAASADELTAHCRSRIASYKIPKSYEFRGDLPRSPAGKILKRLIRDEFWAGQSIRV